DDQLITKLLDDLVGCQVRRGSDTPVQVVQPTFRKVIRRTNEEPIEERRLAPAAAAAARWVNQESAASEIEIVAAELHQAEWPNFEDAAVDQVRGGQEHEAIAEYCCRRIGVAVVIDDSRRRMVEAIVGDVIELKTRAGLHQAVVREPKSVLGRVRERGIRQRQNERAVWKIRSGQRT